MEESRLERSRARDRKFRSAFFTVVDAYNQMKATIGTAPAIDYFASQLGKAKYKCDISFLRAIDFCADFDKIVNDYLNEHQLDFFKSHYIDTPNQSAVSDRNMMLIQKTLGRVFVARQLWPLSEYFAGSRA